MSQKTYICKKDVEIKNLLFIAFVFFAQSAFSQYDSVIKLKPVSLLYGNFNFGYERVLTDKNSIQFNAGFMPGLGFSSEEESFTGVIVGGEYRFFFSRTKEAPNGFYIGPYLSNINVKIENQVDTDKSNLFNVGGQVGHEWAFDSGVVLDLNAGAN